MLRLDMEGIVSPIREGIKSMIGSLPSPAKLVSTPTIDRFSLEVGFRSVYLSDTSLERLWEDTKVETDI